jgi:hypothetical protein
MPFSRIAENAVAPLTPHDIEENAELAIVVTLAHTLDAAIDALLAAFPELGADMFEAPSAPLRVAEAIIAQAHALRATLDSYRHAVEWARSENHQRLRHNDELF